MRLIRIKCVQSKYIFWRALAYRPQYWNTTDTICGIKVILVIVYYTLTEYLWYWIKGKIK